MEFNILSQEKTKMIIKFILNPIHRTNLDYSWAEIAADGDNSLIDCRPEERSDELQIGRCGLIRPTRRL
jgi:hypothetical protein